MSKRSTTTLPLRFGPGRRPQLANMGGGLATATMTLVTAVAYAAVAAAPLGVEMSAAAVLSGLIGAIVGGTVAAVCCAAPGLVYSPRASVAVVMASALTALGSNVSAAAAMAWLSACVMLAALLQCVFALLRLGALIRLIPHSVTAGFTIGIAVEMAWSQLPHLLAAAPTASAAWAAPLVVGGATVAAVAWARRKGWADWALVAGVLAGVLVHAALTAAWPAVSLPHLQSIHLDATPLVGLPAMLLGLTQGTTFNHLPSLFGFATVIAFVSSVETLSATVAVETLKHQRFDANRALLAGALGSMAAVCAGGLPVAASAATSVANVKTDRRSQHSPLVAAGLLIGLAALVGNLLSAVPLAVVSALLITVAFTLVREPLRELVLVERDRNGARGASGLMSGDTAVAALVCALLLTTSMVAAVIGGITAAAVLIVWQMRLTLVRRQYDANHPDATVHLQSPIEPGLGRSIRVLEVAQPMFFATADAVVELVERVRHRTRVTILDLTHVGAIDTTAQRVLSRLGTALQERNRHLLLVPGARSPARLSTGEPDAGYKLFVSVGEALRFAAQRCEQRLQEPSFNPPLDHDSPDALPISCLPSWSRKLKHMASSLRAIRHPADGVPEIHNPLDPQLVELAGRQLAVFVGPMAKVLARRAAPRCPDLAALYRALAREIHSLTEREAFLRLQPIEPLPPAKERAPDRPAQRSIASAPSQAGLSLAPDVLEQATRELTPYLGSIAKLLVKRAQAKALDREHLYRLLARQLSTIDDQQAFLSAAGIHTPLDD
jgi:sulfate permease, SulP family